jgi:NADH-quinone oxidoreductase subunit F
MAEFEPVLLANINKPDSWTRRGYESTGGYEAVRKVIGKMAPKDVAETVKNSGLRGRGGAGFPTGLKWTFLPQNHPGPIYFCLNADESEPGTFNNRVLMELDPHQVLEGMMISCYATNCKTAYYPGRHSGMLRRGLSGQEHLRHRLLARHFPAPRCRGLHLR